MLRNVSLWMLCIVLGGVGCKEKASEAPPECKAAPQPLVSPVTGGRMKFARRPNGDFALMSADGSQVIVVQPEGYQVCEPTGGDLKCGPLTQMTVGCPPGAVCPKADPCPCTLPACKTVCAQN
jgi:hypothetical protein